MTWLLSLLVNHSDVLTIAQSELDNHVGNQRRVQESDHRHLEYHKAIGKETLRLYPPGPLSLPHKSMEDCTFSGRSVRKGTWLIVNMSKIQYDPRVWSDPDEFRPDRFLATHKDIELRAQDFELIPFGSGRRMCPGVNFALRVMHLTLATLLHGFDFVRPGCKPVDMTEGIGLIVPRATPLDVLLSPRLPPHLYG
ncbi:unnamed protein product [Linum trigynum]|uniref:Cytochrome P450 n=1 Tax=Linum trigynum TaxID=586398 RepID=A0AAV2GJL0_9ROSI